MGQDAVILFKTIDMKIPDLSERKSTWQESTDLLPDIKLVHSDNLNYPKSYPDYLEVEHQHRFYDETYPRGNWPAICYILMSLFAHKDVTEVIYGNDEGDIEQIQIENVLRLSAFYMEGNEET